MPNQDNPVQGTYTSGSSQQGQKNLIRGRMATDAPVLAGTHWQQYLREQYLHGVNYPVSKNELIQKAKANDASDTLITSLNQLADKEYHNASDIEQAFASHNR